MKIGKNTVIIAMFLAIFGIIGCTDCKDHDHSKHGHNDKHGHNSKHGHQGSHAHQSGHNH